MPQYRELTYYWHFRNTSSVNFFRKCWFIVIDVMDLDDKLRFRFHWSQSSSVDSLGTQGVKGFLFPVNSPSCMNISCFLINYKKSTSPISWQNVFEGSISLVLVWMKLKWKKTIFCLEAMKRMEVLKYHYYNLFYMQQMWLIPSRNLYSPLTDSISWLSSKNLELDCSRRFCFCSNTCSLLRNLCSTFLKNIFMLILTFSFLEEILLKIHNCCASCKFTKQIKNMAKYKTIKENRTTGLMKQYFLKKFI